MAAGLIGLIIVSITLAGAAITLAVFAKHQAARGNYDYAFYSTLGTILAAMLAVGVIPK